MALGVALSILTRLIYSNARDSTSYWHTSILSDNVVLSRAAAIVGHTAAFTASVPTVQGDALQRHWVSLGLSASPCASGPRDCRVLPGGGGRGIT